MRLRPCADTEGLKTQALYGRRENHGPSSRSFRFRARTRNGRLGMNTQLSEGARSFVAGLRSWGCSYEFRNQIVVFRITPAVGAHIVEPIETGVALNELDGWPMAPPHWIHLPSNVAVGTTNARPSSISGWLKHSRNVPGWGNAEEPAQAWLAHLQSVLDAAQPV